ncbi:aminotransferase class IV family protein [Yinghuangia soli]|uniref:Aminotransferase class IV family protein n=1 Tax=Yinghuangia soli TaxID=2908204 RepID=A0AA41Q6X2_9ACTN|nr:aminotransferase class IV family protein [Yinghuangia soli]MCF2531816.1 aminotransferase class IV family protein [Yinghuangia soli]
MELDGVPATVDQIAALGLVNYGHFTSMRVDDGRVRGLALHLERLRRDCGVVFGAELDTDRVLELVRRAVDGRGGTFVVRVTVYDPALPLANPGADARPRILVTHRAIAAHDLPPLRVKSVEYRRDLPAVKHVGLFAQLHARRTAQAAGFDDALFVSGGEVSEGGTWNVGFVDGSGVVWPSAEQLVGVTRQLLDEAHPGARTAPVRVSELGGMQAAFATNTSIGVRPIAAIDGVAFDAAHPALATLAKAYADTPPERL